jgi:hypothetical protein
MLKEEVISQCYDGAPAFCSGNSGVQVKIRDTFLMHIVVSQKMVVGINKASGYLVLDEGRMGAGHLRIDIQVVEDYTNI